MLLFHRQLSLWSKVMTASVTTLLVFSSPLLAQQDPPMNTTAISSSSSTTSTTTSTIDLPADPVTIVIGSDPSSISTTMVGWTDGVCYQPIGGDAAEGVHPGDILEFQYAAHNVYQMSSRDHYLNCDFTDATLLAQVGESPFQYTIPETAVDTGVLYFACQVGDHCASGSQKVQVAVSSFWGLPGAKRLAPVSRFVVGASVDECDTIQNSTSLAVSELEQATSNALLSECSEPVPDDNDSNLYTLSCLSGPATLTPGGVINRLFVMYYPYPKDKRVVIGQRTFEFVEGDPMTNEDGSFGGITPVPVNQLYVHHLSGRVVFGQGSEGLRQTAPDAPFPKPYAALSGDEGDAMIFHLIDLRQVDDWLSCVECRCPINSPNTYLDELTQTGNVTGGVNCCSNCTSLTEPTTDYRMRYNISYRELQPEDEPVTSVDMLTADISPAAGSVLEHDVPSFQYLPPDQQDPSNPFVQRLERVEPFNQMFYNEFFQNLYAGPDTVQLVRCVAHLHVAAITMYLEDTVTGERLCQGDTTYGKDPEQDQGFLTAVKVDNYDPPKTFPSDRLVRFVSEYNATQVHTGVMGYWFLFVASDEQVSAKEVNITVDLGCIQPTCDASLLPAIDMTPFEQQTEPATSTAAATTDCVDTLEESPACTFGGLCDCETFVTAPESSGCDGFYASAMGDIEVRSVCANYCGCDVTEAVDAATSTTGDDGDCVDTLAESPACTFGGLCDCEDFVNADESDGCDGFYYSAMGDVEVRSVCAKYCGCDDSSSGAVATTSKQAPAASTTCKDTLSEHPACRFGGVCECEEFVNAPESEGCGGLFKTEMGDTVINDVCAAYCNACVDKSVEEIFEETYLEVVTLSLRDLCHFATPECQSALSNMYACAEERPGIEAVTSPMIRSFVIKHGHELALQHAKLGDPSLHANEPDQTMEPCISTDEKAGGTSDEEAGGTSSGTEQSFYLSTVLGWMIASAIVILV